MTSVSIIIPFYNAAETLGAALESGLNQSDCQVEIIAINDGSTDNSLQIANSFDPAIQILTGLNQGVSATRNRGISASSGDWILFLDADDLLTPGTIAQRLKAATGATAEVIVTNWQNVLTNDAPDLDIMSIDWSAVQADTELAFAAGNWATTAAILYSREIVESVGGFRTDLPIVQDARLLFDAAYHRATFTHSAHVGAYYRVHSESLSRRNSAHFAQDCLRNGSQIEHLWRERGPLSDVQNRILFDIYNNAGRTLFLECNEAYFQALNSLRAIGLPMPLHARFAAPLARTIGLRAARALLPH